MKYIFTLFLLFIYSSFSNSKIKILVMKEPDYSLLYQVLWNEASITSTEELKVIVDCIKYRVEHRNFPNTLDSVLLQPFAFSTKSKEIVPIHFTKKIDSLWKLPIKYRYLYFRSEGYKYSSWMKRKWYKPKNMLHEYAQ